MFQLHACHTYGCGSEVTTSTFLAVIEREVCVEDSKAGVLRWVTFPAQHFTEHVAMVS